MAFCDRITSVPEFADLPVTWADWVICFFSSMLGVFESIYARDWLTFKDKKKK